MTYNLLNWTMPDYQNLVEHLKDISDEKYKNFHQRLVPNVENLLGVRMPKLQSLSKEITKGNWQEYLSVSANFSNCFYEEIMLKGLVIGNIKANIETVMPLIAGFVPKINNWAICDCFCSNLKITKKNNQAVFEFIQTYLQSQNEFELRFLIVMLMDYFIDDEHIDMIINIYDGIKHDGYYVKMAVAWGLSVCYVKQEKKTMKYLNNNNLDDFTYNKALQKIIESNRVTTEQKSLIRQMKRK